MSNNVIYTIMICAAVASAFAAAILYFAMIADVNSRPRNRIRISYLSNDIPGILRAHRLLSPDSPLRLVFVLCITLSVIFGAGYFITSILFK